jgi:hypothetical protein
MQAGKRPDQIGVDGIGRRACVQSDSWSGWRAPLVVVDSKHIYRMIGIMTISASVDIAAPRGLVVDVYREVTAWPVWDREVVEVSLPDGVVPRAAG